MNPGKIQLIQIGDVDHNQQ